MPRKPKDEPEPAEGTAAQDGEPNEDELQRRRDAKTGSSVAERVANGESDEPAGEMFPHGTLVGDPKVTVKNLIKAGAKVSTEVSMTKAAVPNPGGGLFDPEEEAEVLVRVLPGAAKQIPIHGEEVGGRHKVKEWKIAQELRVVHVQHAGSMYSREQIVDLLHEAGVAPAVVSRLLGEEPKAAQG
jgi:hypothetical protein